MVSSFFLKYQEGHCLRALFEREQCGGSGKEKA